MFADFDVDNDKDGQDFLTWQRGHGITSGAALADGDANGDEAVNGLDLTIWQTQFGTTATSMSTSIPEPSTLLLSLLGLTAVGIRHRKQA